MSNYYTVDKIIRGILLKMGEDSLQHYSRLLPHAYDFLDEFKTGMSREVKTVKLKMSQHRTVKLPDDFVTWGKIGIVVGEAVRLLSYNDELSNLPCPPAAETESIYRKPCADDAWMPFLGHKHGELLGYGQGGYRESFSIDHSARMLRFGSEVNVGEIYLEYISNELDVCGDTPVNMLAVPALENYVLWKYYLFRLNPIYRQYEDYYYQEKRKLGARLDPWSIADIYAGIEANYSLFSKS